MTALLGLGVAALLWFWVLYAPGHILGRALVPAVDGAERQLVTLICAFAVVPLGYFLVAVALSTPTDAPLYLVLATAINAGDFVRWWQRRRAGKTTPTSLRRMDIAALAATAVATGLLLVFGTRHLDGGDLFNTLQHCLYVIVMHTVANDASWSIPLFDAVSGGPMHVLVSHTTDGLNGLAPLFHEQRLGNAAVLAPHVALLGMAGWVTASVHAYVIVAYAGWCLARRLDAGRAAAGVATAVFILGMNTFLAYVVNENVYATAVVGFLAWGLIAAPPDARRSVGMVVVVGLLTGHLVGIRHTAVLFWPAVLVGLAWAGPGALKRLAIGGACALVTVLPWLWVNLLMLGNPVAHPKVIGDSDGRVVTNTLFGLSFRFKAMNWPFAAGWVRTAWSPFPTLIWLPLMLGRCFGQLGVACGLMGVGALRRNRRALVLLALFAVPHSLAIGWLELLDWEQLSYATPGLFPLLPFMALGIQSLIGAAARRRQLIGAAVFACVVGASLGLRWASFDVDTRGLDPEHWSEAPQPDRGVEALRTELTAFQPLPRLPVPRMRVARQLVGSLAMVVRRPEVRVLENLPVYESGRLAVLVGYEEEAPRSYEFVIDGLEPRSGTEPIRSAVGLHTVMLRLPATHVVFRVTRHHGRYAVDARPMGQSEPRDFTFYLNPWRPALTDLEVTLAGGRLPGLRLLPYGGRPDDGEELLIATNYPKEIVDTIAVPFTVETKGEEVRCGLFLFVDREGGEAIETLVLAGGHVTSWRGEARGNLIMPRNLGVSDVILFSEPYCSTHVPQHGDRYGRTPLNEDEGLTITLDGLW